MLTKKARSLKWLVPIIVLVGGGVAVWQGVRWFNPPEVESSQERKFPPVPVETAILTQGEAVRKVTLLGQVEASERATIRAQVDGIVKQVPVKVGDRVESNQIIAMLDDSDQKLALLEAEARLAQEKSRLERLQVGTRQEIIEQRQAELNAAIARTKEAQDNLKRISQLTEEGALSERDLVQAEADAATALSEQIRIQAQLSEAEAGPTPEEIAAQKAVVQAVEVEIEQAKLDLTRTVIKADFPAIVESRQVSAGDYLESGDPLITVINNQALDIFLEVPERLIGQIQLGQVVNLSARALPDWQQTATVEAVVQATETATRRQIVRLSLNNPPLELLPGMSVQANLELPVESEQPVFIVSRDALTRRNDQWLVFTVRENTAQSYTVEMLADMGKTIAITHPDLQPGNPVVVIGSDALRDGSEVRIVKQQTDELN